MEKPQECYVAFLDILGFGNFVETKDAEYVYIYLSNLVTASQRLNLSSLNYDISIFSDSIIISAPLEQSGKYITDKLFLLYINSLLLANIVVESLGELALRGAITKGTFFTDGKNITFGKALIEAYKLESAKAVYPRVLVATDEFSPEKAKESSAFLNTIITKASLQKKFELVQTEFKEQSQDRYRDGEYLCCNYLSALYLMGEGWASNYKSGLMKHKNFIEVKLSEKYSNDNVHEKYIWMKTYHNWFCSGFPETKPFMIT